MTQRCALPSHFRFMTDEPFAIGLLATTRGASDTYLREIGPSCAAAVINRSAVTYPFTSIWPTMGIKLLVRDVAFWNPSVLFAGM